MLTHAAHGKWDVRSVHDGKHTATFLAHDDFLFYGSDYQVSSLLQGRVDYNGVAISLLLNLLCTVVGIALLLLQPCVHNRNLRGKRDRSSGVGDTRRATTRTKGLPCRRGLGHTATVRLPGS